MQNVRMKTFRGAAPRLWHRWSERSFFKAALTGGFALVLSLACESRTATPSPDPAEPSSASPPVGAETRPALPVTRVEVTRSGFQPSRVDLGSARSLVTVNLPVTLTEEGTFQCGMGMHRGKVVAR